MIQYLDKCEAAGADGWRRRRSRLPGVAESSRFWPCTDRDQPGLTCKTLIRPHFWPSFRVSLDQDIRNPELNAGMSKTHKPHSWKVGSHIDCRHQRRSLPCSEREW